MKLRKVDLKSLATFLSKVETGRSLVLVTRLQIRRSFGGDGTTVDVDLTATTYERIKDGSKKPLAQGWRRGRKGQGLDDAQREAAPAWQDWRHHGFRPVRLRHRLLRVAALWRASRTCWRARWRASATTWRSNTPVLRWAGA